MTKELIEANNDEVICPNCVTQFRAIPVNVQNELRKQDDAIERLELEITAATLRIENDTKIITSLLMDSLQSIGEYQQAGAVQKGMALDAARYRWIVDHISNDNFDALEAAFAVFGDADECTKDEFDAAIDASMKGGRK